VAGRETGAESMKDGSQVDRRALLREALEAVERMEAKLEAAEARASEPIAIIGMGCRLPGGANDPESFWQLLRNGVDAVTEAPPDRWTRDDWENLPQGQDPPPYRGGFIDDVDKFDARFFGLSAREARTMDPQHRLLLEVSCEALERAGQRLDRLAGSQTSVYVGIATWEYAEVLRRSKRDGLDFHAATGTAHNTAEIG